MELDFDASNLVEDEAVEVEHNVSVKLFCFECIDNWSTIMNLCPLCQREFQLITCVPVFDSGESSKVDEDLFACLNYLSGLFVLNYLWPIMINLY
ncbi:putative RING finger protein [Arabidopsis thaliana]|uniref:Putative RING finger protein n=1 Tax=Arabidopsis thaliana TaxID=3702 RepID=Q9SN60_ARATH|nr:putative RING finger protein [Arabidopsis thaliana]CAB81195.1 putative RING finger protein [Arabidopsis thaliana]